MRSFDTDIAAKEFVRDRVDIPITERIEDIGAGGVLHAFTQEIDETTFTNVYDLSFPAEHITPSIEVHSKLTSVYDHVRANKGLRAATGGGFFFLADQTSSVPRQLGLNLAMANSQVQGFPVVDREAVLVEDEKIRAEHIRALGMLTVGNYELSWSGSLTSHETDSRVFAVGNCIITHMQNDATGSIRVLEESSRYTPAITTDDTVDIGFIKREDGAFVGVTSSHNGNLDIFPHDVVIRMHERYAHGDLPEMYVRTIGDKAVDGSLKGALSVGPMLDSDNFSNIR